jgi:hypothetical protein
MKSEFYSMMGRFILFSFLILSVAGCGSSSPTATTGTGGLAVKLVWNAAASSSSGKTTAKTLLLPLEVKTVRIIVSVPGMTTKMQKDFLIADYPSGGGTMDGIPSGDNRTVKAQGLDAAGLVFSEGKASNPITIQTGLVTDVETITMRDIVTATPRGGTYSSPQTVTLSASTAGTLIYYTIYYTTSGQDPDSPSVVENVGMDQVSIPVSGGHTILKYFANFGASILTPIKSEVYDIP